MSFEAILETAIGVVYIGLSWVLYLSPAKEIWSMRKSQKTSQSPIPYIIMAFNAIGWVALSIEDQDIVIFWTFVLGIWTSAFYGLTIYSLTPKKGQIIAEISVVLGLIISSSIVFVTSYFLNHHQRVLVFGIVGCSSSIALWFSPMIKMFQMVKERDSSSMPLGLISATAICCSYWLFYGIYHNNIFIMISTGSGTIIGWFQLLVVFAFKPFTVKAIHRLLSPFKFIIRTNIRHENKEVAKEKPAEVETAAAVKVDNPKIQSTVELEDRPNHAAMTTAEVDSTVRVAVETVEKPNNDADRLPPLDDSASVIIDDAPLPSVRLSHQTNNSSGPLSIGVPSASERSYERFLKGSEYPTVEEPDGNFRLVVQ